VHLVYYLPPSRIQGSAFLGGLVVLLGFELRVLHLLALPLDPQPAMAGLDSDPPIFVSPVADMNATIPSYWLRWGSHYSSCDPLDLYLLSN
jgi:hypothetical protein